MKKILELIKDKVDINEITYNSTVEEAIKLALRFKKENKNLIVIKENNYIANELYNNLSSFLEKEELIIYLKESSFRINEFNKDKEEYYNEIFNLYKIINNQNPKLIICSPFSFLSKICDYEQIINKKIN